MVDTGVQIEIPSGCYGRVAARSGLSVNHGLDVGAGVIDPDYRGTIKILMRNLSDTDDEMKKGDRIAQIICERIVQADAEEVKELKPIIRGQKGFGKTEEIMMRMIETLSTLAQQQKTDKDKAPVYKLLQKGTKLDDSEPNMTEES